MDARTTLRCDATSPACARRFVADVLSSRGFAKDCIERAVLLTSELATNAVVHAKSDLDLVVVADFPMARVEVHDQDPSPPAAMRNDVDSDRGRGILVVEALAEAWGIDEHEGNGKTVWFEVRS